MADKILSIAEARHAAKDSGQYLLWLEESQARFFKEPGWIKLEPPRQGRVLFMHPDRKIRIARQRGIL